MFTIYIYVLDTLADWEIGYVTAELNSGRYFKKDAQRIFVKTVSHSKETIQTMGGMTIIPDCTCEDIAVNQDSMLLLPGADTWSSPIHHAIMEKAAALLSIDAPVAAICGATTALANYGLLDHRSHTSNGPGFLDMFCPSYKGSSHYINQPAVRDHNLITASSTGSLEWARHIIEYLNVFQPQTLEAWYLLFSTGNSDYFYSLMESLSQES